MSEYKKANIAFVGCGSHSTHSLYPAVHTIPQLELAAVCDLKEELVKRNARWFGAKRWYIDLHEMLKNEELDGVVIVGPPQMHCEVGKQCLDAGLPIHVEKPSAISYADAVDLAEYAEKKGLWGSIGYMKRYSTCYGLAKSIVGKGEFGKISMIDVKFSNGPYPAIWGIKENAKAFLIGQVVHIFDLVRFFGGEIGEVYAKLNQVAIDKFGYAITLGFRDGAVGVMNLNALELPEWCANERLVVTGLDSWLEVVDMVHLRYYPKMPPIAGFPIGGRRQAIEWKPDWTEFMATKSEGAFGYRGELEGFARSCLGEERPRANLWDGASDLQVSEAVWQSATSGRAVGLDVHLNG